MPPTSFALDDGTCLAVMGPSGSGKTLLLRAVADLDPSDGLVALDGRINTTYPAPEWRRMVTYVAAEPGWWADTPAEHFADWAVAEPMAETLLLPGDIGGAPISRLSTGERQRLALLRALMGTPRVLLLDEPTGPLDDAATGAVEGMLRQRMADGTAILLVTHDPAQAARLAGHVLRLSGSRAEVIAA